MNSQQLTQPLLANCIDTRMCVFIAIWTSKEGPLLLKEHLDTNAPKFYCTVALP